MKVFNISDRETKLLKQRNLVGHSVVVGRQLLGPGQSADVPDDIYQAKLECLSELVKFGVLAIGAAPKGYQPAPVQAAAPAPAPAPSPMQDPVSMRSSRPPKAKE